MNSVCLKRCPTIQQLDTVEILVSLEVTTDRLLAVRRAITQSICRSRNQVNFRTFRNARWFISDVHISLKKI
jgi:hypothetical protein